MKSQILKRSFSLKEDILLALLALILLVFLYYFAVDQPVRTNLANAASEKQSLEVELAAYQARLQELQKMQKELEEDKLTGKPMPSYNAVNSEMKLLNDIMSDTEDYSITFSDVTREGKQIRRNFQVQFVAKDYDTAINILQRIADSEYRCLIQDISCSGTDTRYNYLYYDLYDDYQYDTLNYGEVTVTFSATFYETMVGGKADSGLPAETEAQTEETTDEDYSY